MTPFVLPALGAVLCIVGEVMIQRARVNLVRYGRWGKARGAMRVAWIAFALSTVSAALWVRA